MTGGLKQIHLRIGLGEGRGSKHSYTEPRLPPEKTGRQTPSLVHNHGRGRRGLRDPHFKSRTPGPQPGPVGIFQAGVSWLGKETTSCPGLQRPAGPSIAGRVYGGRGHRTQPEAATVHSRKKIATVNLKGDHGQG
eukprot:125929-Hanusia_phi.AAC.1